MTCEVTDLTNETYNCLFEGYLDAWGELQLGMMLSLMVAVPLYAKYEDPIIPAIGLMLVAGIMWTALPAFLQNVAWVIVFVALTMGVFTVMYRVVLS